MKVDIRWAALMLIAITLIVACSRNTEPVSRQDVRDLAGLLEPAQIDHIAAYHEALHRDHGVDFRILTVSGIDDLDAYANESFRAMQVGGASAQGRGALLVVDPTSDRVRLEVGARLEGVLTDAFVAYVERAQMVPFFRAGRIADGVLATTELLVQRFQEHGLDSAAPSAAGPVDSFAAGGGANQKAFIGAGTAVGDRAARVSAEPVAGQPDPQATVTAYLEAMANRNSRPDLGVYSQASRDFLAQWTVTPAQMDNVVRASRACEWEAPRTDSSGRLAVVRAAPEASRCAPWFLIREDGLWRLDLTGMSELTRFGRDNDWRFVRLPPDPYAFAFVDWEFSANGHALRSVIEP